MVSVIEDRRKIIKEDCYYDIIGDVHGFAYELQRLLKKLGYTKVYGVWQHSKRKAVFVGDFIDRGPDSKKVLEIVRGMVEYNKGYAVLGNHELNFIMHMTKDNGKPIRRLSESSKKLAENVKTEFMDDPDLLKEQVKWLRTLPLHLDFGKFRVAHAYWNDKYIELIEEHRLLGKLKKSTLKSMADPNHPLCNAVNRITKGIEFRLPDDLIIKDSKNIRRSNFRIKWWESPKNKTFHELSYGNKFKLPEYTVPEQILFPFDIYDGEEPLLFFGHYCMGKQKLYPKPNICCVDACVANGGALASYSWNGEKEINPDHFNFIKRMNGIS